MYLLKYIKFLNYIVEVFAMVFIKYNVKMKKILILFIILFSIQTTLNAQKENFDYQIVYIKTQNKKLFGIDNLKGESIIECKYDQIGTFKDGYCPVKLDNKYGYIDFAGRFLISPIFNEGYEFSNGYALVCEESERFHKISNYGFIDTNGYTIIPCMLNYNHIFGLKGNHCVVFNGSLNNKKVPLIGKYGLVNKNGNEVVPCIYDEISPTTNDGFYKVYIGEINKKGEMTNGKVGLIDTTGNVIIPIEYQDLDVRGKNSITAYLINKNKDKHKLLTGVFNLRGETIIPMSNKFFDIGGLSNNIMQVSNGKKYGFINQKGNLIIDFKYTYVTDFVYNIAVVKKEDKWFIIDTTEKILSVIDSKFSLCRKFNSDSVALIYKGNSKYGIPTKGKYGLLKMNGDVIAECIYDTIYSFSEGLAMVVKDKKYGFIDKKGNLIIPTEYDYAFPFSFGLASVKKNEYYGYIDKTNNVIIPFKYYFAHPFVNGMAKAFSINGKQFINTNGGVLF